MRWEERGRTAWGGYALCEGDPGDHELWEYRKSIPSGGWAGQGRGEGGCVCYKWARGGAGGDTAH